MKFINFLKLNNLVTIKKIFHMKHLLILSILVVSYIILSGYIYSEKISEDLAKNVVRLHVIANSDSKHDQQIKLMVRDSILKYMEENSKGIKSADEAKNFICKNLLNIENIACTALKSYGSDYSAKAYFGKFVFPTKVYGDVTLPSGEYQSLRVVLGNGIGKNWWCVMFPPLCFVDASTGVLPDESKLQLKSVLTEEEYKIALGNAKNTCPDIKIKFKIVELLQQSKFMLAKGKR
ncbi:MAG: stage II sporulation protein R [Deltaproteobacteria bacterium]